MRFSIIIPVHNAQDRICKLLDIIESQTFKDYELICVCDACTDRSASICRAYTDNVFEVWNHNDGLTRSVGLDVAKGEWVLFIDDDDWWLQSNALALIDYYIRNNAYREDADVLCFGFVWQGYGVMPSQNKDGDWVNVWSKAWKRSAIGNTRFPKVHSVSDFEFTKEMYKKPLKISHIDEAFYYYNYLRPGSISETDKNKEVKNDRRTKKTDD